MARTNTGSSSMVVDILLGSGKRKKTKIFCYFKYESLLLDEYDCHGITFHFFLINFFRACDMHSMSLQINVHSKTIEKNIENIHVLKFPPCSGLAHSSHLGNKWELFFF